MPLNTSDITKLGWNDFFQEQLDADELEQAIPCRVMSAHRGHLMVSVDNHELKLPETVEMQKEQGEAQITVGDWLLLSRQTGELIRRLVRSSLIQRQMAGVEDTVQLIAANVDTLFIVTSCNDDFQLSRLERYLALAYAAGVNPVIVLTKQDLTDDLQSYIDQARSLGDDVVVEAVNGRDDASLSRLHPWCQTGHTVALIGSSGVGKSTLVNGLGAESQKTGDIREDDAKGRHTTTHRSLLPLANGAVLLDSPGIRGVSLVVGGAGIETAFSEVIALTEQCRFRDCKHVSEPGCAIKEALSNGELSRRRLDNYTKLIEEQEQKIAVTAQRLKKGKSGGRPNSKSGAKYRKKGR